MRVAFDIGPIPGDHPTGVGIYAAEMARALTAELEPDALAFVGRRPSVKDLPEGYKTTPLRPFGYFAWLQLAAARDAALLGAEVGHFSSGLVPLVRPKRTVLALHDLSIIRWWRTHPVRRWPRIPFALAAPHLADLVVVPSRATADEVIRLTGSAARRIAVIPYAPQTLPPAKENARSAAVLTRYSLEDRGYVLALGTIEPRKNYRRLVEAFELAVADRGLPAETRLVIAGAPGWGSTGILDRIAASPISNRISVLGYVPAEDMRALLEGSGAVAYVSLYEGFGLPVVEAMACGAPTVTSNVSSMPEVAGDAGFLVNPFDPKAISRGLVEAFRAGTEDTAAVGARSRAQAATFSWAVAARELVARYRRLC